MEGEIQCGYYLASLVFTKGSKKRDLSMSTSANWAIGSKPIQSHESYQVLSPVVPAEMVVCSSITVTTLLHDLSKLYDLKHGFSGGPPSSGLCHTSNNRQAEGLPLGYLFVQCTVLVRINIHALKYLLGAVIMRSVKTSNMSSETSWTPSFSIIAMSFLRNECW